MQDGHDLASLSVHVDNYLCNQRTHNSFLQSSIAVGVIPYGREIPGQVHKLFLRGWRDFPSLHLLLDPQFDFLDLLQRLVPPTLQFIRYQAVLGIRCIILFRCAAGRILCCLQLPSQGS